MSNLERFQAVVNAAKKPVFVEFGARWCQPCRVFGPTFESIGKQYSNHAIFITVDIDEGGDIAAAYGISSIPHVKVFKQGEVVGNLANPKEGAFRTLLRKYIKDEFLVNTADKQY